VRNHPLGTVNHGIAWRDALEEAFPHVSARFLALEEARNRRIVAGFPLYTVKSWAIGNRLVCVPFAAWCDPLVSDQNQLTLLLGAAAELEKAVSGRFTEVRVRRTAGLLKTCGWVPHSRWLHHYVKLDRPRADLWRNLSRTAVRRLISSAERSGVEIARETSQEAVLSFAQMLSRTRKRLGLQPIPPRFFNAIRRNLNGDQQILLLARRKGLLHAGIMATQSRAIFHLDYAATKPDGVPHGTMQLLYWRAMEIARNEGCAEFSLGRTDPHNDGLVAYKRHWGCVEEELCTFRDKSNSRVGSGTHMAVGTRIAKMCFRSMPGPLHNLAGAILYRHR